MKDYTNLSPVFRETIRIPENGDLAHADNVFNVTYKALQDNVLALKALIDGGGGEECSSADIVGIIERMWNPDWGGDDTGQIDDDGTVIEEATQEDIQGIMDSYWND